MSKQTEKIKTLRKKVQTLIQNNEYRSVKLHGATCSRSDLENIEFYAEKIERDGNYNGFMKPCGATKEVFDKLGIGTEN